MNRQPLPQPAAAALDEIVNALRRGDRARADAVFAEAGESIDAHALVRLGEVNLRRKRWADAAWLFDHAGALDTPAGLKHCLAKNLSALETHRSDIYAKLVDLPTQTDVVIAVSANGKPTIACRRGDGSFIGLSPGNNPVAAAAETMRQLQPVLKQGNGITLAGMGDGYLLHVLSRDATPLFCGMRQPVFVCEPDPQVALHCLMIHDYSGANGPIEQRRFFWFVGPDWDRELEAAIEADPFMGCGAMVVAQSIDGGAMRERVHQVALAIVERDRQVKRDVDRYYTRLTLSELNAVFGPNPPRRPRVLLLTTRFSTVLQYSTRDAAEAFEQIGWDAEVLIEPTHAHRLFVPAMRKVLADFKPDLLLQIDHLRHEHGDLFPPNLPFACWAQDHLPNLTNANAAAQVGLRDFVLVGMPTMYVNRYSYPRRQCVALTKLTRLPQRPAAWASDGDDLVYVSTASQTPEALAEQLLLQHPPAVRPLMAGCGRHMIEHYAAGGSLPTHHDVRLFVEAVERKVGAKLADEVLRQAMIDALFDRLGNLLYRQQSLHWAVSVAKRHGLSLALYGSGWDKHPTFAPYARGHVQYGPALEELTRRSRINLVLEPFFAPSHQRLLDGLVAGGFFLLRDHPTNTLMPELSRFLNEHAPADARTVDDVRAAVTDERRAMFDALLARAGCIAEFGDAVEYTRNAQAAGTLQGVGEALPFLADVSFADEASLEATVLRFLGADADRRAEIAAAQREGVEERLSYAAGMRRTVDAIARLLADEAAAVRIVEREAA